MKYIDAVLLRAEIEKRMHICDGIFERDSNTYYQGKAVAYQETLSFTDSLQQEQPSLPDNLDEAAEEYSKRVSDGYNYRDLTCGFIAGAKWQKEQDDKELSDLLTIAHLQGAEQMKEQMMKEAVEGDYDCQYATPAVFLDKYLDGIKDGDKVRIIIVKEEKK